MNNDTKTETYWQERINDALATSQARISIIRSSRLSIAKSALEDAKEIKMMLENEQYSIGDSLVLAIEMMDKYEKLLAHLTPKE